MNNMKKTLGVICLTVFAFVASAQVSKEHAFQAMDNLLGNKWDLKVQFADGSSLEQKFNVTKILKGNIYRVETYGNVATAGKQHGLRNEGMRGWSEENNRMEFVEADVFGGFVTGDVVFDGMDILYNYVYAGQTMTDAWVYKSADMYEFISGVRNDKGQWTEMTMNGQVVRQK